MLKTGSWHSPDGSELLTCTIITTGANITLKSVHDRMPVILDAEVLNFWLSDSQETPLLKSMLQPYDDAKIQTWAVSKEVNSPSHNYPKVLETICA